MLTVYCENHTEHINTACGQNEEVLKVRPVVCLLTTASLHVQESERNIIMAVRWNPTDSD
jgi:hypothetical protein